MFKTTFISLVRAQDRLKQQINAFKIYIFEKIKNMGVIKRYFIKNKRVFGQFNFFIMLLKKPDILPLKQLKTVAIFFYHRVN